MGILRLKDPSFRIISGVKAIHIHIVAFGST